MFRKLRGIAALYLIDHSSNAIAADSYRVFCGELLEQLARIRAAGCAVFVSDSDPHKSSDAVFAEVTAGSLTVYAGADLNDSHPLAQPAGVCDDNGRPLLLNHVFRLCHDYYGHASGRNTFSARGEVAAFRLHAAMFSNAALPALAAETVCQVAVFYAQPKLWKCETGTWENARLPRPGDSDFQPLPSRDFAPQKTAVLAGQYAVDTLLARGRLTATLKEVAYDQKAIFTVPAIVS